jgi:hypothetical protein
VGPAAPGGPRGAPPAEAGPWRISGHVRTPRGAPVPGVRVEARRLGGPGEAGRDAVDGTAPLPHRAETPLERREAAVRAAVLALARPHASRSPETSVPSRARHARPGSSSSTARTSPRACTSRASPWASSRAPRRRPVRPREGRKTRPTSTRPRTTSSSPPIRTTRRRAQRRGASRARRPSSSRRSATRRSSSSACRRGARAGGERRRGRGALPPLPPRPVRRRDEAGRVGEAPRVRAEREGVGPELLPRRLERRRVASRDRDLRALAGEGARRREPDPAVAARHHRHLAVEPSGHRRLRFPRARPRGPPTKPSAALVFSIVHSYSNRDKH